MGAAAEQLEHTACVGDVSRLAQDVAVADDACVGAEDDDGVVGCVFEARRGFVRVPDSLGFLFGEALDVGGGGFFGEAVFVEVGGGYGKLEARLREQFAAARRG